MSAAVGGPSVIIVAGYVGVAFGGILAGVLQSLVLRRQVARAGRWALAGVVVFGVGAVNADVGWALGASLFGPVVGLLQWRVRRRQVAGAGWWVLASTVGWVAGMAAGDPLGLAGIGAMYGAITGLWLARLLREPVAAADNKGADSTNTVQRSPIEGMGSEQGCLARCRPRTPGYTCPDVCVSATDSISTLTSSPAKDLEDALVLSPATNCLSNTTPSTA